MEAFRNLIISQQGKRKTKRLLDLQARRQDLAAGGHVFKIQYWMYVANVGPNVKWGYRFQMEGPGTTGDGPARN